MNDMLKQAQKIQEQIVKKQEELGKQEFEASAGGDMVSAKVNGKKELLKITLSKEVVDKNEIELLEDLVLSAVNAALSKVDAEVGDSMKNLTGGLNIPGLPF